MSRTLQSLIAIACFVSPSAIWATSNITFCPDGTQGSCATAKSLDWTPDSTLSTAGTGDSAVIPWAADTTKDIQTVAHGALGSYLNTLGTSIQPACIQGGDCEITFVMAFGEKGTSNADFTKIIFPGVVGEEGVVIDPAKFINIVHVYYDDLTDGSGSQSNPLSGQGYADGTEILTGFVVDLTGSFTRNPGAGTVVFDQSGTNDWPGTLTIAGTGSQALTVLISNRDPDFFPDVGNGSLMEFNTTTQLPYKQQDPSKEFEVDALSFISDLGAVNGASGPDFEAQTDPNSAFTPLELALSCRVTGGGNDTSGIFTDPVTGEKIGWDGTEASGSFTTYITKKIKGKLTLVPEVNYYTFGGQAGANTGQQPQPKGELSHTNHEGPSGRWTFHAGTASAPPGTEIDEIICSDEGWCRQARPAPTKQIDFDGIGTFREINASLTFDAGNIPEECASVSHVTGNSPHNTIGTYNWFEVHISDRGEPGSGDSDPAICPATGSGTQAFDNFFGPPVFNTFVCKNDGGPDCADFYRIRIYCGLEPTFDADGNLSNFDAIKAKKFEAPIYEVYGYLDGGNWQIHPPTGFDLK